MSESAITECPKCQTCFKVTLVQMSVAAGAVRCGACLFVFKADEYFTEIAGDEFAPDMFHEVDDVSDDQIETLAIETQVIETLAAETPSLEISESEKLDEVGEGVADSVAKTEDLETLTEIDAATLAGVSLNLNDDPDELLGSDLVPKQPRSPILMFVLSGILVVTMGLQYLWFNQHYFVQNPSFRAYFEFGCQQLGCVIKPFADTDKLSTSDLLVRSHGQLKGVLSVDVMLKNSADFRQKFPLLKLVFSDKSSDPIAERAFEPKHYLAGELKGLQLIPANTEVRISLEIVDPGANAVGYLMEVLPSY